MLDILRKIFPSANQRRISEYTKIVTKINSLEDEMSTQKVDSRNKEREIHKSYKNEIVKKTNKSIKKTN